MKVVAVVAHPDDEALGCGGALAKLSDAGWQASVVLPTRRVDPRGRQNWSALLDSFQRSCGILGAEAVVLEPLIAENEAEAVLNELHDGILPWIEGADLVLTHWPGDVNQVHRAISRAVEIATRPFRRRRDVLLFEIATSTEQGFGCAPNAAFAPTGHVLLSSRQAERKRLALSMYPTEAAPGRTAEDVERRMRLRGAEVGAEFAEAYVVARHFL